MPTPLAPIDQILDLLESAPIRIAEATANLSEAQLHTAPGPDEWSANDILAHLRACSDMWGKYIQRILAEDSPTFRAINPRQWIKKTDYLDLNFHPSFESFSAQRADLLSILKPLPQKDWARSATVTGAGKPLILTIHSYGDRLAIHERSHVKEITRLTTLL